MMGHKNLVVLYGALCRKPKLRIQPGTGKAYCQFQMAINRPLTRRKPSYEMTKEEQDALTDYPYVVTHGELAEQCSLCLGVGSEVIVEGSVETRNFTEIIGEDYKYCPKCGNPIPDVNGQKKNGRTVLICPTCNSEITIARERSVTEIHAKSVEFVSGVSYPRKAEGQAGSQPAAQPAGAGPSPKPAEPVKPEPEKAPDNAAGQAPATPNAGMKPRAKTPKK